MARLARFVVSGFPHHIIQRGNRRQKVFFTRNDYLEYLKLLKQYTTRFQVDIVAYCLMPNHVHIIAIPKERESLARAIGETHRNYTKFINFRENWRGYLWQGRFSSYVLGESYLISAVRYILQNPVKAKIVRCSWEYEWSSAKCHMGIEENHLVNDKCLQGLINDWKEFLKSSLSMKGDAQILQQHEKTGRPLGDNSLIEKLEKLSGIILKKKKPGRKKKTEIGIVSP